MRQGRLPTLQVDAAEVAPLALVVGDPERARQAAALLDGARLVGANREFHTYTGQAGAQAVTVCSHGVGSAGAGICFEELIRGGARTLIRAGTCGALRPEIEVGGLVVATGAVRDEGLTPRLVPLGYPAVAHHEVVLALEAAARQAGVQAHLGVVLTSDLFYPSAALGLDWRVWLESRVAAVEMELSALLVIAALYGLRAGGIFAADGYPAHAAKDMSDYDPLRPAVADGKARMLRIALAALQALGATPSEPEERRRGSS